MYWTDTQLTTKVSVCLISVSYESRYC